MAILFISLYFDIIDENEVNQYIKEGFSEKEAILNILYDFLRLDKDNEDNQKIMNEYILSNLKCLDKNDYLNNQYVTAIKKCGRNNKYSLRYIDYEPYQLFAYDDIKVEGYKEYSQIGYFKEKFSYLALTQNNNIWMSLNPNEIETMKPYIEKGKGNVLVLGLGLGYVPFMLINKEEVKSVTIVEKDEAIISLFNELIFPYFPHKDKIRIIKDEALTFTKKAHKNAQFDYIFADLWHNPEDGLPLFVSLKAIDKNIDCWLETSMYALLRRCMITLLEEQLNGYKEDDYKHAKNYTDKVINLYYQKTKNYSLDNKEKLLTLLKEQQLLAFITR